MTAPADMTDADMDAAVAERVMGWTWTAYDHPSGHNRGFWQTGKDEPNARVQDYNWRPTTDPHDSRMVVERMRELGFAMVLTVHPGNMNDVGFQKPGEHALGIASGDFLDRAICEAALEALSQ